MVEVRFDRDVYKFVAERVVAGYSNRRIASDLEEHNIPRVEGKAIAAKVRDDFKGWRRSASGLRARKHRAAMVMFTGLAIFVFGVLFSMVSYWISSEGGAGRLIVAGGAIVVGSVQALYGGVRWLAIKVIQPSDMQ